MRLNAIGGSHHRMPQFSVPAALRGLPMRREGLQSLAICRTTHRQDIMFSGRSCRRMKHAYRLLNRWSGEELEAVTIAYAQSLAGTAPLSIRHRILSSINWVWTR